MHDQDVDACETARVQWMADGSLHSLDYDDVYHSDAGAIAEAEAVFLQSAGFPERWQQRSHWRIGELGFGTGLNFLLCARSFLANSTADATLDYFAVEKHPLAVADARRALAAFSIWPAGQEALIAHWPQRRGWQRLRFAEGRIQVTLVIDEALAALEDLAAHLDVWLLDGFAPARNPAMWRQDLLERLAHRSAEQASLHTYSAAGAVRRGLQAAGFSVEKIPGFGRKRSMLRAHWPHAPQPLSRQPWWAPAPAQPSACHMLIIGAGIAGCATAYQLALRGYRPTVADSAGIAAGASGNPIGMIESPAGHPDDPYTRFHRSAWRRLCATFAADPELAAIAGWNPCGRENLSDQTMHADAATVRPVDWCQALFARSQAQLIPRRIAQLARHDGQWLAHFDDGTTQPFTCVILCTGISSNEISLVDWLPLQAVRGQMSQVRALSTADEHILDGACYLTPAQASHQVLGATFERDSRATDIRETDHRALVARLAEERPDLAEQLTDLPWQGRASIRACTPDRLPLIGPLPDLAACEARYGDLHFGRHYQQYPPPTWLPGAYIHSGHGSRGLGAAFLGAEYLADCISGRLPGLPRSMIETIHPLRFAIRHWRRGGHGAPTLARGGGE